MPNEENRFSWRARLKSFTYAGHGLKALFKTEHNAWIHFVLSIVVAVLAIILKVSRSEAAALVIVMAMVWVAELFNTALEKIADFISPQKHPQIKIIKDLAAAAVLITAIAAFTVGCIIFIPKLF